MKIAITGGIGTGKSYVCCILEKHGITVYDCDKAAKRLMANSAQIKKALTALVGEDAYDEHGLCKSVLATFILKSEGNANAVDNIVHPAVAEDFKESGLDWIESAILFDSGFNKRVNVDYVICVTAPLEIRIQRIVKRDNITVEKAMEWINTQLPSEEVMRKSDFIIHNDGKSDINEQIEKIIDIIYK